MLDKEKLSLLTDYEYYDEVFQKKASWNWGAFFFSFVWLIYRKMYIYAAVYLIAVTAISYLTGSILVNLAAALIMGGIGNKIYLYHAETTVGRISRLYSDPEAQRNRISQAGGTTFGGAFIASMFLTAAFVATFGNF